MNQVVSLRNIKISFEGAIIFNDVNIDVASSEFVYLLGPTGSGKSSLLKLLYADLLPASGKVKVNGFQVNEISDKDVPFLRRSLGVIFQDFELLTDRTVEENLHFVMKATGWKNEVKMRNKVDELLEKVHLPKLTKEKMPHQLSGGEQQRVAIARALVNSPKLILADEPTGNLDPKVSRSILQLFKEINEEGTCVIMATHQHSFLKLNPERALICEKGIIKDISKQQVQQRLELGK
ncbi:cell division ATP-binding protein FtsE [Flammeovirga agarivorans]|uniref:Cell division ATP-binding protein FtsE n=1 Tax=Flammeovirga agarivorans TaxID=2726742 RepID=A0A7X8SLG4_9BACT|nr:ATP-binding cassette domain-containing protein [Flammeovirga agarivorans]NLR92411.1 ATP-binding cassette domain-containing protein [Flammeovirga agarivorans]